MGYAFIIKNAHYGTNRVAQVTLVPGTVGIQESLEHVYFTYGPLDKTTNTMSLSTVSISPSYSTAKYTFALDQPITGVSVDPMSGKISISPEFSNQNIKINAINASNAVVGTITVNPENYEAAVVYSYRDLVIDNIFYKNISAIGGNTGTPTVYYSYIKQGTDGSEAKLSLNANITYEFVGAHAGATISSKGVVTFTANTSTTPREYTVKVTVTCPDKLTSTSSTVTVTQSGKEETPSSTVTLTSISAVYNGSSRVIGSILVSNNFTVTANYSDGSHQTIDPEDITLSTNTVGSVGNNTVTVSYNNISDEVIIVGLDYITGVDWNVPEKINNVITSTPIIQTAANENYDSLSEYNLASNVVTYTIGNVNNDASNVSGAAALNTSTGEVTYDIAQYLNNFTGTSHVETIISMNFVPVTNTDEITFLQSTYRMWNDEILFDLTPTTVFTNYSGNLGGSISDPDQIYLRSDCHGCVSVQCNAGDVIYMEETQVDYHTHKWFWETSQPIVNASGLITGNLKATSSNGRYTMKNSGDFGTHTETKRVVYKVQNDNYYITAATFHEDPIIGKITL